MLKYTIIIIFSLLLCTRTVFSQWDFAVVTEGKIIFYDEAWNEVISSAHQFSSMSAIAADEVNERIYFNDHSHDIGSIFSLKLPLGKGDPHDIDNILTRTPNETIAGLAYDPLNENLYWTDLNKKKILYRSINDPAGSEPNVLFDFNNSSMKPNGIAIDVCRRKLYWTNSNSANASIHMASLNGKDEKTLINSGLYLPHGIVVDQISDRIYYVVKHMGTLFTVESAELDGTDRKILVEDVESDPFSLTVAKDVLYWTDTAQNAIWKVPTNNNITALKPVLVKNGYDKIRGMVSRVGLINRLRKDSDCKSVIQELRKKMFPLDNSTTKFKKVEEDNDMLCLSNGLYSKVSKACSCKAGYSGARCETYGCHNFCVHGTCEIDDGFPKCYCQLGYSGERCQTSNCTNYCMNGGQCNMNEEGPTCRCKNNFLGPQCSVNATEECAPFCLLMLKDIKVHAPRHCNTICKNLHPNDTIIQNLQRPEESCRGTWNRSVIVLVCGGIVALVLIYVIIQTLHRIYKPARPRIKKTFVVQKKVSQTPLTCRPIATEKCEITIENCCNMNICDTPCFDTKLLQQNMSIDSNKKEDTEILINNMEGELY